MSTEPSRIHLDPAAVNALVEAFVNKPGTLEVQFVDGRIHCRAAGLDVTVTGITVDADGVDITLALGGTAAT